MMMVFSLKSSRAFFSASGVSVGPSGPAMTPGGSAPPVVACAAAEAFGVVSEGAGATAVGVGADELIGVVEALEVAGCAETGCEGLAAETDDAGVALVPAAWARRVRAASTSASMRAISFWR